MAVQTTEVDALKKPALPQTDPRTLRILNAIIANKTSITESHSRECYDKTWDQTFGTGKFRLSARGSDDQNYTEVDEHGYSVYDADYEGGEPETEAHEVLMEVIQDNIMSLFEPVTSDWYDYEATYPQRYEYNPYAGGYNLADADTYEYISAAEVEYDDDGNAVGINDGMSCMRVGSHEDGELTRGQEILNAKLAMENPIDLTNEASREAVTKATLNAEEGYLDYNGECVNPNSVLAKKVELAQAEIANGGPVVAKAPAPDGEAPATASVDAAAVGPNAQGNDYAVAAQALVGPPAPAPDAPAVTTEKEIPPMEIAAAAPAYKPPVTAPSGPAM